MKKFGITKRIQSTMSYNLGDVILVPFPFTNQTQSKKRPAVIVNSTSYNQRYSDVILMAITSQVKHPFSFGEIEIVNWQNAGLLKPSVIKPVFTTIETSLILRRLGSLDANDKENLKAILQIVLG